MCAALSYSLNNISLTSALCSRKISARMPCIYGCNRYFPATFIDSPLIVLKTHQWCNYYISIQVKSLSQRVDGKILNFDAGNSVLNLSYFLSYEINDCEV